MTTSIVKPIATKKSPKKKSNSSFDDVDDDGNVDEFFNVDEHDNFLRIKNASLINSIVHNSVKHKENSL